MKQINIQKNNEIKNKEIRTTNEFIEIKNSSIHNFGVFAVKDIPKGTKIIEYIGRKITKKASEKIAKRDFKKNKSDKNKGAVYIFELNKKYDIDGNVPYNSARFINHSCNPNCEAEIINGKIWIKSLRNIKNGEELSYDYGYNIDDFEKHPCYCKAENCIGYIVSKDKWLKLKKILEKRKSIN
ncbi:MAG: SET domain-containing protein-lysine N-methyltransferase [Candidatus Pacearchaeota archaeon]